MHTAADNFTQMQADVDMCTEPHTDAHRQAYRCTHADKCTQMQADRQQTYADRCTQLQTSADRCT